MEQRLTPTVSIDLDGRIKIDYRPVKSGIDCPYCGKEMMRTKGPEFLPPGEWVEVEYLCAKDHRS